MPTNTSPTTTHVITINSKDRIKVPRDQGTPSKYQVALPQRYRNVWSAQLLNFSTPPFNNPPDAPPRTIYLRIDKLNNIDSTSPSGGVDFCFAKIPLIVADTDGVFYADALSILMPVIQFQNPIASLDSLYISITDADGKVLVSTGEHTMQIQLQCGDYINNGGGSTIHRHGRFLGGTH